MLLVAGLNVVAGFTAVSCIQTVTGTLAVADVLHVSDGFRLLLSLLDPGLTDGVVVLLFLSNMLLLAVLLLLAFMLLRVFLLLLVSLLICSCDPGVPILAGGFTYWIVGVLHR